VPLPWRQHDLSLSRRRNPKKPKTASHANQALTLDFAPTRQPQPPSSATGVETSSHSRLLGLHAKPETQSLLDSQVSPHCPEAQRYGVHDRSSPSESISVVPSSEHVEPLTQRSFTSQALPAAQSESEAQLDLQAVAPQR
jgi:hypothetical protein